MDGKLRGEEAASELVKVIGHFQEVNVDVSLVREDTSQPDQRRGLEGIILPDGTERLRIGKPGAEDRPWNSGMHATTPERQTGTGQMQMQMGRGSIQRER